MFDPEEVIQALLYFSLERHSKLVQELNRVAQQRQWLAEIRHLARRTRPHQIIYRYLNSIAIHQFVETIQELNRTEYFITTLQLVLSSETDN